MDHYQALIRTGEPVAIIGDGPYSGMTGIWLSQYPSPVMRHVPIGIPGVKIPCDIDYTTDSIISIIGKPIGNNHVVIPDHMWLRIDPQTSLYKIIMSERNRTMFQMHQMVDIIDGLYTGKSGFINGIHMDANTHDYVVRLNQEEPENISEKPVEVTIPVWCLADHVQGRFDTVGIDDATYKSIIDSVICDLITEALTNIDRDMVLNALHEHPSYTTLLNACQTKTTQYILSSKSGGAAT